jgi:ABC-2 type transport system permease protein
MYRYLENSLALKTILRREIMRLYRIWSQTLLPSVISMALYFLIFGNLIGERIGKIEGFRYIDYIVPGLIMMAIITNSYGNVVASFFGNKFQRSIEEMLISPMPNSIILWGFVLGGVARGITVGILVTLVSSFFTELTIQSFSAVILVGILSALLFSLAGLVNAIYAKKFDDINIVPTFVLTPLTYLGGVFYSVTMLPQIWQKISRFNPIFYIIDAFRFGILGHAHVKFSEAIVVILTCIVLLYLFSMWLLNRGIGLKN